MRGAAVVDDGIECLSSTGLADDRGCRSFPTAHGDRGPHAHRAGDGFVRGQRQRERRLDLLRELITEVDEPAAVERPVGVGTGLIAVAFEPAIEVVQEIVAARRGRGTRGRQSRRAARGVEHERTVGCREEQIETVAAAGGRDAA